jgi:hypothetical protein
MEDNLQWKRTSNGRRPQMEDDLKWKTTSNGRRPLMEDDLKILKVEYLSNRSLDQTHILNLSLKDHIILSNEDNLQWEGVLQGKTTSEN